MHIYLTCNCTYVYTCKHTLTPHSSILPVASWAADKRTLWTFNEAILTATAGHIIEIDWTSTSTKVSISERNCTCWHAICRYTPLMIVLNALRYILTDWCCRGWLNLCQYVCTYHCNWSQQTKTPSKHHDINGMDNGLNDDCNNGNTVAYTTFCMLEPVKKLACPYGYLNQQMHSHYNSLWPTLSRISQLSTHHSSISTSPRVVTHSTPHIVHADLHSAFISNVTSG